MPICKTKSKKGFTLLEIVVVLVILGALALILVPVVGDLVENANQAADQANARLLYNSATLWFMHNQKADADLTPTELGADFDQEAYPAVLSNAFQGNFSISVTISGYVEVRTSKPAIYDPGTGKLIS